MGKPRRYLFLDYYSHKERNGLWENYYTPEEPPVAFGAGCIIYIVSHILSISLDSSRHLSQDLGPLCFLRKKYSSYASTHKHIYSSFYNRIWSIETTIGKHNSICAEPWQKTQVTSLFHNRTLSHIQCEDQDCSIIFWTSHGLLVQQTASLYCLCKYSYSTLSLVCFAHS